MRHLILTMAILAMPLSIRAQEPEILPSGPAIAMGDAKAESAQAAPAIAEPAKAEAARVAEATPEATAGASEEPTTGEAVDTQAAEARGASQALVGAAESDARLGEVGSSAPNSAADDGKAEGGATVGELIGGTATAVDDWKTLGWVAGLIALINLLTHILRFKPLNSLLESKELKHIKPWIAAALGAVGGGLTTFQTGAGVMNSAVAGLLAGMAAIGAHELMNVKKRKAQRLTK